MSNKQEKKELKQVEKLAKKAAKKEAKKDAKAKTKALQKKSVGLEARKIVESIVNRKDVFNASTPDPISVAGVIVKEFQFRAPVMLTYNGATSPVGMVAYLMWAYFSKMRKVGLLDDPASSTTTFTFPEFPANASLPTPWAKFLEYSMPYEDPATGRTISSRWSWTGLPTITNAFIGASGTNLSLNNYVDCYGLSTDVGAEYGFTSTGTQPTWAQVFGAATTISVWLSEWFQCATMEQIPDWAPDASMHSYWEYDSTWGKMFAASWLENFDPELTMVFHSPLTGASYPVIQKPLPPVSTVRTTQILFSSDCVNTSRKGVLGGYVKYLADIPYRIGPARKLIKRHPHWKGLKSFVAVYQLTNLAVYSDLVAAYIREGGDAWANATNALAFNVYAWAVLLANIGRTSGIWQPRDVAPKFVYNVGAFGAPLPPSLASFVTDVAPIVRAGKLVVPILPAPVTANASYVKLLVNNPNDGTITGNMIYYSYISGFPAGATISGTTFNVATFTSGTYDYPVAPVLLWNIFSNHLRQNVSTTFQSWVPPDPVYRGGKSMDAACVRATSTVSFANVGGVAALSQASQLYTGTLKSYGPLSPLEAAQCFSTALAGDMDAMYQTDVGFAFQSPLVTVIKGLASTSSQLSEALSFKLGERSKTRTARVGGTVEVLSTGETALDAFREVSAPEMVEEVEGVFRSHQEPSIGTSAYQYFVGEMDASAKRMKDNYNRVWDLNAPNFVTNVLRVLGLEEKSRQGLHVAKSLIENPEQALISLGLMELTRRHRGRV